MAEHEDGDLRTAAKAAAATAAVGAAVGVARAIAARAEEAGAKRDDGHEEPEAREEEDREEPVRVDAHEADEANDDNDDEDELDEAEPAQGTSVDRLRRLTDRARDLLQELSGSDVESVSAIDRTRDGFRITVEAVEVRRIPESTDVLATYDVELDGDGDLVRYERRRRYARSQSDNGGGA